MTNDEPPMTRRNKTPAVGNHGGCRQKVGRGASRQAARTPPTRVGRARCVAWPDKDDLRFKTERGKRRGARGKRSRFSCSPLAPCPSPLAPMFLSCAYGLINRSSAVGK